MRSPASTAATTPTGQSSNNTNASNTGTIRHRHKKSRPAPPPPVTAVTKPDNEKRNESEMYVGGNNSIKAQWRHQPILLITGSVKYSVNVSEKNCCVLLRFFFTFFV